MLELKVQRIKSDGSGSAGQAASLTGSISAMVVEILANGEPRDNWREAVSAYRGNRVH